MRLPIYQIDAFTSKLFQGNPAAVVPLSSWLNDRTLQAIAAENNLSETAFFVPAGDGFHLRWFTPMSEVDLCGHATLATAWLILMRLEKDRAEIGFQTRSGLLKVARAGQRLLMNFPSRPPLPVEVPPGLVEAMGIRPIDVLAARDHLLIYENAAQVRALKPDMNALEKVDCFAACATAPGEDGYDCVSRFFVPREGIPEDPVTGSAHCTIVPYWSRRLGKTTLNCYQASARGGELLCTDRGDRISLEGECVFYLEGWIEVSDL